jgi:P4 family phage/plasmid primase-like protien
MLEIIATAEKKQGSDLFLLHEAFYTSPIYEVFDIYDKYYHIEENHKKCLVFKTDCAEAYLYLFPSLPEDKQIQKIFVERESYIIPYRKNTKIQPQGQGTPFIVYPNIASMRTDFFKFIGCEFQFNLKLFINELEIERARYICSNLHVNIKKREGDEKNSGIILYNSLKEYKIDALDLDSIWEENFLPFLPNDISDKYSQNTYSSGYTCLEIECEMKNKDIEKYEMIKDCTNALYALCCFHETDYSVSRLFCEIFRLSFICSDYEKKTINTFKNNRWCPSDAGICVRKTIIKEFPKKLFHLKSKFLGLSELSEFSELSKFSNKLSEIVPRICFMVQNQSFRNKMFSDCCEILYDGYFSKKINSKNGLISFDNGVYDIENKQLRPGIPSDYIVLSTNIPYNTYDVNSPDMKELMGFLNKIFPIDNIMKYFIRFLSSCLERGNKDKIFSIWSGPGNNGKSVLVNLISLAFGEYSIKLPTSLISGKRSQSASATPELTMIEGTLISFLQEPDETERINPGIVKELTGNDTIYARQIYERGKNIRVDSKFVLIANRIPHLGITDDAVWNRIKVIPFLSTFVDDLKEEEENMKIIQFPKGIEAEKEIKYLFKKDIDFSEKLPYLAPALMYLLTEEYKYYKLHGLEEPEEIQKYTQELKTANDPLGKFIKRGISTTENIKDSERIQKLYEIYKIWFKKSFPNSKVMDVSIFCRELKKRGFSIDKLDNILKIKILDRIYDDEA